MRIKGIIMAGLTGVLFLSGCGESGGTSARTGNQTAGVNEVLEAGMAQADQEAVAEKTSEPTSSGQADTATQTAAEQAAPTPEPSDSVAQAKSSTPGIDVDLTALSATMVYSEVYNMMVTPEDYIGKIVKMDGEFSYFHDEVSGNSYYACIIQDATACCAQGIEFDLTDDYTYPDDYPEVGGDVTVVGSFDTYSEGDYTYATLRDAELV